MSSLHMTIGLLLSLTLFSMGCMKQEPETQTQKFEALSKITDYNELVGTEDKELSEKIKKLEESDDESLDVENLKDEKNPENRILIAGDSWAVFPCIHDSLKKVIKESHSSLSYDDRCGRTTKLGIEASEWIGSKQDKRIKKYLNKNAHIKYLYLSLGGNDLISKWTKDFTLEQELELFEKILANVKTAINSYHEIRPDLKVIVSGYDFPNFKKGHDIPMFRKIYSHMGEPPALRINQALVHFTQHMSTIANFKNVYFINHMGLGQYYDGVQEQLAPLITASPEQISPFNAPAQTGGDVNLSSCTKSMKDWMWIVRDAFHLSERNYKHVMKHTYDNVLVNITPF